MYVCVCGEGEGGGGGGGRRSMRSEEEVPTMTT